MENKDKQMADGLLRRAERMRESDRLKGQHGGRDNGKDRGRGRTKKRSPLWARLLLRLVLFILIFALGCGAFWFFSMRFTKFFEVKAESRTALVEQQLSYCQELVTAKYRYSDIITLKKSAGFAKSYSIVKYTGLLRAGIADFTDVSYYLSADEKTVTIRLPRCEILGNEIVRQEVFDEKQSIFVPISTQEIFDEIDSARRDVQEDMIAEGILDDSAEYARKIIRQFMLACGFEDVIFER